MHRTAMHRQLRRAAGFVLLAALYALTNPGSVWSQQNLAPGLPTPHVTILGMSGAKAGTTFELALSGENLDTAESLMFSVPGIKAELVSAPPTPDTKRGRQRDRGATATARFKVTVPADTPHGIHDVRLVSKWGVGNPRAFVVGDLEEIEEKEPNSDVDIAQKVPLNCAISGTISAATDVDYYAFEGKKNQRVVISCLASSIDSKLQPQIQVFSKAGSPLAFSRDYNGTDALTDVTLPTDGEYFVRVVSFTYTQGGPEYFYRLSISTTPWIDAVYPSVIEPGKETKVTVHGRNLPGGVLDPAAVVDGKVLEKITTTVKPSADPKVRQRLAFTGNIGPRSSGMDGFELRLKNNSGMSNPYLLTYSTAPVVLDNGVNKTEKTAQELTLPCEIAGRVAKVRDRNWYRFAVKKGQTYSVEVYGDRLGGSLDMYFTLRSEKSTRPQEFDDNPDILHQQQFYTRTDDPQRYKLTATDDTTYYLQVSSREADVQAGPRHLFRVRITEEKPDFRLVVLPPTTYMPEGTLLQKGTAQVLTVLVWRQDGFNGEISLTAEGLPPGVTCPPQVIGPGVTRGSLIVKAEPGAATWTGVFTVKGRAKIGEKDVEIEARPADVTWSVGAQQQNTPTVSRLSRSLAMAVRDGAPFQLAATAEKTEAKAGDKVTIHLKLTRVAGDFKGPVQVTLFNPMSQQQATLNNNQPYTLNADGTVTLDLRSQLPPGTYSFVVRAMGQVPYHRDPEGKQNATATVYVAALPVTITVTGKGR